jgi:ribosome-associated protein
MNQNKLVHEICQKIYDKKGFNILAIDVRGVCEMTDYFIIAEGNVERHVQALSRSVYELLQESKLKPHHTEGDRDGDWIVLDYGDMIIHLFIPDMREKYRLEQVWKAGKVVDVPLSSPKTEPALSNGRADTQLSKLSKCN